MTVSSVRFVGLDVHKEEVEACLVNRAGRVVGRMRLAANRSTLEGFATQVLQPTDHVALEATTHCWAVADVLRPHVARVVVSHPLATKAIAQAKVKTDRVDAQVLAQLLRCGYLPEVWAPDEATRRLRELCGRRSALVGQRTALRNRIHSVLTMRLVEPPRRLFSPAGRYWLEHVALDEQARVLIDSDLRQLDAVQAEIDALEEILAQRGYASAPVRLLMILPGVDRTTAQGLLAAWGDVRRFPDGDHAASYLGLVPSTRQSAKHCYHGPITKQGRSQARTRKRVPGSSRLPSTSTGTPAPWATSSAAWPERRTATWPWWPPHGSWPPSPGGCWSPASPTATPSPGAPRPSSPACG